MKLVVVFILCLVFFNVKAFSQQHSAESSIGLQGTLLGPTFLGSLDLSFLVEGKDSNLSAFTLGALPMLESDSHVFHLEYSYNLGSNGSYLELGGGMTFLKFSNGGLFFDSHKEYYMPTVIAGWRWHGWKHFIFRINLNALLINWKPMPWPGLSVGYRF